MKKLCFTQYSALVDTMLIKVRLFESFFFLIKPEIFYETNNDNNNYWDFLDDFFF